MAELLSSKVIVVEEEPKVRGIPSAPTSVAGAVCVTERGPIGKAALCTSFEGFQRRFGRFTLTSDLALAAMGFFENGGSQLWVVRTVHYDDISDPATATALRASGHLTSPGEATPAVVTGSLPGPFRLADGDRLVVSVDGGPEAEVAFHGSPARLEAGGLGPFALEDGQTLLLRFDEGPEQEVLFSIADFADIGAALPAEVVAVLNAHIDGGKAVRDADITALISDTDGRSSRVEVTGGTANAELDFPVGVVPGGGNVEYLAAVTVAEVEALVEAAIRDIEVTTGAGGVLELRTVDTGAAATLRVQPATAEVFGLDHDLHQGDDSGAADAVLVEGKDPGAYANRVEVEVRPPTSGEAGELDLAVIEDGTYRETFPNLSMDPAAARYLGRVVNDERTGSSLIRATDLHLPGPLVPSVQTVGLAGGDDGLADLDDADFVGSEPAKTGLHAFDQVQDLSVQLVPGRATSAMHNAMVRYCEVVRDGTVFAVLDSPAGMSAVQIVEYVRTTAGLLNLTEHAAICWPRVKVLNPLKSVLGPSDTVVVPPSGIIAGVFTRTDGAKPGGVYDPPAGIDKGRMFGVPGFETDEVLEETKRDLVYPKRINPLTTGTGLPRFIDGSRTLMGDGNFPYLAERRGVIFIERSLKQGLQFARHKNNTEGLRAQVRRTITAFLITQMNNGAFRSREPDKAFFVDVSETLNTPSVVFAGKLIARVGLATNKPAEFIILSLSQDVRALDAMLAGQQ
jgi:uncharacterized protein